VLTAVIIFSVVPAAQKTNQLITEVANIVKLEVESSNTGTPTVAMGDLEPVTYTNGLQINLKSTPGDDMSHYAAIDQITVYLNKTADDYHTLSGSMTNYENSVAEIVSSTISQYTKDEVNNNRDAIKNAILSSIQEKFGTTTIADISLKNLRCQ
jgi:hypothetical protein